MYARGRGRARESRMTRVGHGGLSAGSARTAEEVAEDAVAAAVPAAVVTAVAAVTATEVAGRPGVEARRAGDGVDEHGQLTAVEDHDAAARALVDRHAAGVVDLGQRRPVVRAVPLGLTSEGHGATPHC